MAIAVILKGCDAVFFNDANRSRFSKEPPSYR